MVSRVRENRKEYLRLIRVTAAIERNIDDWETLKDTWVHQHIERRGTKRKILDTSSIPVSTVNRELLRFAFNQNEGRLSRREVYDIVERCDGTVAAVLTLLEARMSDYIIVQPSQWATSSEQPTSISDGVNSSGLSTNPFGLLSDAADEEEDDVSSNASYSASRCCPGCGNGLFLGEECCVVMQEDKYCHDDHSSDEESDGDVDEYGGDFLADAHRYPLNVSHLAVAVDDMAVAVDVETVVEDEDVSQSEAVEGTSTYMSFLVNVCPFKCL